MKKIKANIEMKDVHYGLLTDACKVLHMSMNKILTQIVHDFIEISIKEPEDEE